MRTEFIVSELTIGLRRNKTMTAAALVTITIAVFVLGGALMTRGGANRLQSELFGSLEVSVYMQPVCGTPTASATNCLTPAEETSIHQTLLQLPQVKKVTYISPAQAYQIFKTEFADDPQLLQNAPKNALPSSFAVELYDPHQFGVINSAVSQAPGVQVVTNASQDLKALFSFFHKFELGMLFITVVLLGASLLLIYNTMLVAAFTRRRETGIMRLVGASDLYIQAPFVLEGTVIGVVGTSLAIGLLALVRWFVSSATQHSSILMPFGALSNFTDALLPMILVGILLPALASFLTLRRHLRV